MRIIIQEVRMDDEDEQDQISEFEALSEIYPPDIFQMSKDPTTNLYSGKFIVHFQLDKIPLTVLSSTSEHSIRVNFLPPIICNFNLPINYPSWSLPDCSYSSTWLSKEHLESLNGQLQKLSLSHSSECILWFWFEYLEKEALKFLLPQLCESDILDLSKAADNNALIVKSDRVPALLRILDEFNSQKEDTEFYKQSKECIVCGQTKPGSKFVFIRECAHFFCIDCISNHYTGLIIDGTILSLTCLQCDVKPPHAQIKKILSEEVFDRYEYLLYQRGLDCMEDVMYCPRPSCNMPVIIDKEDNMGMCAICKFAFCTFCQFAYHGINPCKIRNTSKLVAKYFAATHEVKQLMEKRYGRETIFRLIDETKSENFVQNFTKCCPKCKAHTEKNDGCNKMTCIKCGSYYCWLCLKLLDKTSPYNHFNAGSCQNKLFEGAGHIYEEEEEEDQW